MPFKWFAPALYLLLFVAFVTRVWRLELPNRYVFDEVYHVVTARAIAHHDPGAYDWTTPPPEPQTAIDWLHPPLAKYFQAISIASLGDTSFSWRFPSALAGVGVVFLTLLLAKAWFGNDRLALTAGILVTSSGLMLVQSRIAMNDIFLVFWILLTVWLYLLYLQQKMPWWVVCLTAGLSVASKWSGLFVVGWLGLASWANFHQSWLNKVRQALMLGLIVGGVYLASYGHHFLLGHSFEHWLTLHRQIWQYQTTLTATHAYQSRPWQWFTNARAVWYFVERPANQPQLIGNIYLVENPVLTLVFITSFIASVAAIGINGLAKLRFFSTRLSALLRSNLVDSSIFNFNLSHQELHTLIQLTTLYLIVWLPWQLSPRIMFLYHFLPSVPFASILAAFWLDRLTVSRLGKVIFTLVIFLVTVAFAIWYPHWTGLLVPKELVDRLFFIYPGWQ